MVTGARAVANLLAAPALLARWWVVCRRQLAVGLARAARPTEASVALSDALTYGFD